MMLSLIYIVAVGLAAVGLIFFDCVAERGFRANDNIPSVGSELSHDQFTTFWAEGWEPRINPAEHMFAAWHRDESKPHFLTDHSFPLG